MMRCLPRAIIFVPQGGLAAPASLCAGLGDHRSVPKPLLDAHLEPHGHGSTFKGHFVTQWLSTEGQILHQKLLVHRVW